MALTAPYVVGSETSKAAARSWSPEDLGAQQARVYEAICRFGRTGLTDEEGVRALNLNPSSYRPRRVELEQRGLIVPAGKRLTSSGRLAVIWVRSPHTVQLELWS